MGFRPMFVENVMDPYLMGLGPSSFENIDGMCNGLQAQFFSLYECAELLWSSVQVFRKC